MHSHFKNFSGFIEDRIENIKEDRMVFNMDKSERIVVFSYPDQDMKIDFEKLTKEGVPPIYSYNDNSLYNYDGFARVQKSQLEGKFVSYVQIYRNMIIEAVTTTLFRDDELSIPSDTFKDEISKFVKRCVTFYTNNSIVFPINICIFLLNVKGYKLGIDITKNLYSGEVCDRNNLYFYVSIDGSESVYKCLEDTFDHVWNSFNLNRK